MRAAGHRRSQTLGRSDARCSARNRARRAAGGGGPQAVAAGRRRGLGPRGDRLRPRDRRRAGGGHRPAPRRPCRGTPHRRTRRRCGRPCRGAPGGLADQAPAGPDRPATHARPRGPRRRDDRHPGLRPRPLEARVVEGDAVAAPTGGRLPTERCDRDPRRAARRATRRRRALRCARPAGDPGADRLDGCDQRRPMARREWGCCRHEHRDHAGRRPARGLGHARRRHSRARGRRTAAVSLAVPGDRLARRRQPVGPRPRDPARSGAARVGAQGLHAARDHVGAPPRQRAGRGLQRDLPPGVGGRAPTSRRSRRRPRSGPTATRPSASRTWSSRSTAAATCSA